MPDVRYSDEMEAMKDSLRARAEQSDGEARYLLKILKRGQEKLELMPEAGRKIKRRLWPVEYVREHQVKNLWKLNLDRSWRLIYTLKGGHAEVYSLVIDVMPHPAYDRKFGYA